MDHAPYENSCDASPSEANAMKERPLPRRPAALPEWVDATLTALSRDASASHIILGGGIALKHYDDFRPTQDIDAWWRGRPDSGVRDRLGAAMRQLAEERRMELSHRQWSDTDSYEFRGPDSRRKEFSFQISLRSVTLEEPLLSAWPPLWIETLLDNVGSKMNALVERGAPRDFVDIYHVVQDGLLTREECWDLYRQKNPNASLQGARESVLAFLTRLEARRPLETIPDETERRDAGVLRGWYRSAFLYEQRQSVEPDLDIEMER